MLTKVEVVAVFATAIQPRLVDWMCLKKSITVLKKIQIRIFPFSVDLRVDRCVASRCCVSNDPAWIPGFVVIEDDIIPSTIILAAESDHMAVIFYEICVPRCQKRLEMAFRSAEFGPDKCQPISARGGGIFHFVVS